MCLMNWTQCWDKNLTWTSWRCRVTAYSHIVAANMIQALAKNQFIDSLQDEDMSLRVCQSWPSTPWQALEAALEVESFWDGKQTQTSAVRKAVLESTEPKSNQSKQKAIDQLIELVRQAMKDPLPQKAKGQGRRSRRRTVWCWRCAKVTCIIGANVNCKHVKLPSRYSQLGNGQ